MLVLKHFPYRNVKRFPAKEVGLQACNFSVVNLPFSKHLVFCMSDHGCP
jgi:hypothetical protein